MITQLFLHLVGDYLLQNDWMSVNKGRSWPAAILHCLIYGVPFLLIEPSPAAWCALVFIHLLVDRFQLPSALLFTFSRLGEPLLEWEEARHNNGFPIDFPVRRALWVNVFTDNCLHLATNFIVLSWL